MLGQHVSHYKRDAQGYWLNVDKHVVSDLGGRSRSFLLRRISDAGLRALIRAEEARGAVMTLVPSLDQRRLLGRL